jgi:two-component system C4-dicarboxylate transport sensor histidine kinase DctB
LEQTADRLLGQLESYSKLTNILARHPDVLNFLATRKGPDRVNEFLLRNALANGAERIFILDRTGTVIASSNADEPDTSIGARNADEIYFRAALNGRLGFSYQLEPGRNFFYARGAAFPNQAPIGALAIKIDVERLEFEWHVDEEAVAFFDKNEIVLATNRPALSLRQEGGTATNPAIPMFEHATYSRFGQEVWRFGSGTTLPTETLVLTRDVPQIGLKARVFISTAGAASAALLQTAFAIALLALMALGMWTVILRRRQLTERLAIEEAANASLEARVERRTAELRTAQNQLVQAGKLTALGQMSASISHELAQPLASIRAFADNGRKFIARDRTDEAASNLSLIVQQIDRMTRIIRNLRAFARKEEEPIETVELQSILSDALALSATRLKAEGVHVIRTGDAAPIWVSGGTVRLQQVIVNLLSNAVDAMSESVNKDIQITVLGTEQNAILTVADTGPGIAEPTRIFEPFYSTKDVGASKGMGLGLSISYGIIGSFGGDLTCENRPEGGAEFTILLRRAEGRQAA